METCKWCGQEINWNALGEHSKPLNPDGSKHECPCYGYPIDKLTTRALVEELSKREGVEALYVEPMGGIFQVKIAKPDENDNFPPSGTIRTGTGPAHILVVTD